MKNQKPRNVKNLKQWAYFSPGGWIQVRSISDTKENAKKHVCDNDFMGITWEDYEKHGYFLKQIIFNIEVTENGGDTQTKPDKKAVRRRKNPK